MDLAERRRSAARWLVPVSGSAIGDVDYSGADTVPGGPRGTDQQGVTVVAGRCRVQACVKTLLDAYGLTDKIGDGEHLPIRRATARRVSTASAPTCRPAGDGPTLLTDSPDTVAGPHRDRLARRRASGSRPARSGPGRPAADRPDPGGPARRAGGRRGSPTSSRSATAGWRSRRSRSTAAPPCRWPPTSPPHRSAGS